MASEKQLKADDQKSPLRALILSLLVPGLGQIYAGQVSRGGYLLLAVVIISLLIIWYKSFYLLSGIIVVWLVNIWDAYSSARGKRSSLAPAFFVLALIVYILGWNVTQIKITRLVTDVADIKPLVTSLLQPAFLERDVEMQIGEALFEVPCSDSPPPKSTPSPDKPYLIAVDKTCGNPGETFTIIGKNFWPSSKGYIWWKDPIGMEFRIRQKGEFLTFETDEEGNFGPITIIIPPPLPEAKGKGPQVNHVQARLKREVGPLHLSETFFMVTEKILETIFLALMATTIAVIFAIPVSFLAARNLMIGNPVTMVIYYAVRTVLNIQRSIEPLIMAIIFVVWVGLGPFAGVLALAVHSIAALGKLYSEAVESIDPGPIEAIVSTGANRLQTIVYAVIPQIIPPYIAFTIYRWDINVRMSTVIGFVGGGGIGYLLQQWIRLLKYEEAGAAVWAIALVVAIMDYASAKVREKIV